MKFLRVDVGSLQAQRTGQFCERGHQLVSTRQDLNRNMVGACGEVFGESGGDGVDGAVRNEGVHQLVGARLAMSLVCAGVAPRPNTPNVPRFGFDQRLPEEGVVSVMVGSNPCEPRDYSAASAGASSGFGATNGRTMTKRVSPGFDSTRMLP